MGQVIDKELNNYIARLTSLQKKSLLAVIKSFLQQDSTHTIDIARYNAEIEDAMARMDSGLSISHEDLEKEASAW